VPPPPSYAISITAIPDQHATGDHDTSPIVSSGQIGEPSLPSPHQVNLNEMDTENHLSAPDTTLSGSQSMGPSDEDPAPTATSSPEVLLNPPSAPAQLQDLNYEAPSDNPGVPAELKELHTVHAAASAIISGSRSWPIVIFETIRVLDHSLPVINDEEDLDFRRIKVTASQ
jgi:hypothetical protein